MLPQASAIAAEIAQGGPQNRNFRQYIVKAYDLDGNEISTGGEEQHSFFGAEPEEFRNSLAGYIPEVIHDKEFAAIKNISVLPNKSIVVGAPVIRDGQAAGVVFLLEPSSEFQAVLNGFYWVFSGTLLLGTMFISFFISSYLKEMKKLDKTRRDYIANISHELKSPIASIRALTETLADGIVRSEDKTNKYYGIILAECARLQRLIYEVLELSRMQNKQASWNKEKLDARELVASVDSKYSSLADEMGITFEITEQTRDLPAVYSNRDKVLQLVNILMDNAMKYVQEDGKITFHAIVHSKVVSFQISDNGPGIGDEDLPYIFERFYKSEKAHNEKGSGLGLSIAQEIVTGLGEKIVVRSKPQVGTTFQFTLKRFK
ncbi:hypothetical protein KC345_g11321 [Hortaea werneckii]|nr:hypothetical protein KC345_g11321 [Hortaea werneckii]